MAETIVRSIPSVVFTQNVITLKNQDMCHSFRTCVIVLPAVRELGII